jgi:hypothetical protein
MSLVKSQSQPAYLLIGSGRLARHLEFYFRSLNLNFTVWSRKQDSLELKTLIASSTHVLLAISDQALGSFYQNNLSNCNLPIVHFSGALELEGTTSAHPLMTFGHDLYPATFYQKIHFVLSKNVQLNGVLPGLPNSFSFLPSELKSRYHAACVLGGNFTTLLIQKMLAEFAQMQVPKSAAESYINKILENVLQNPEMALTGPLARKDYKTVQKNMEALEHDPFLKIYQAFVQTYSPEFYGEKS